MLTREIVEWVCDCLIISILYMVISAALGNAVFIGYIIFLLVWWHIVIDIILRRKFK
jgi:hypothetical protein